jgi:hypothetical protein
MKITKKKILRILLGAAIGAGLGFAYYYFIGCKSGSCPITSSPYGTIITGFIAGALIAS